MAAANWSPRSDEPTVAASTEPANTLGWNIQTQPQLGHAETKPDAHLKTPDCHSDRSNAAASDAMSEHDFAHMGSQFDSPQNKPARRPKSRRSLAARR